VEEIWQSEKKIRRKNVKIRKMSKSSLTLEKRETKREMKDRKTAILIFIDGIAQE